MLTTMIQIKTITLKLRNKMIRTKPEQKNTCLKCHNQSANSSELLIQFSKNSMPIKQFQYTNRHAHISQYHTYTRYLKKYIYFIRVLQCKIHNDIKFFFDHIQDLIFEVKHCTFKLLSHLEQYESNNVAK